MKESKTEKYLRSEIAKLGGWCEKHTSPGTKGPPDNIVMWPHQKLVDWLLPHTEFIETKAPNGRLTVLQERDHVRRRAMGFLVHVIWNMDLAEAYLRSRGKQPPMPYKVGDKVRATNGLLYECVASRPVRGKR